MTNTERLTAALCKLSLATGGHELDQARTAVYLEQLDGEPIDAILVAIGSLMRSATFFPSVGEILRAAGRTDELKAAEAWASLSSKDPATEETMRLLGGWHAYGQTMLDKMHFFERRFLDLYPQVAAKIAATKAVANAAPTLRAVAR